MVNSFKLTLMAELSIQEKKHGKDLKIAQYHKSDYVTMQLIKTFFLTTIGDVLVLGLVLAGRMDWLEENADKMNYAAVFGGLLIAYILTMALYLVITYVTASKRYVKARRFLRRYEGGLRRLTRMSSAISGRKDKHERKKA